MPHSFRQLSRRDFVLVALAALQMAVRPTCAQGFRSSAGCFITSDEFARLTVYNEPPKSDSGTVDPGKIPLIDKTQDEPLTLRHGLSQLQSEFYVNTGFFYYEDGVSKNALATSISLAKGKRGTVLFGLNFLGELKMIRDSDIAILSICAHEFAHIYQFFNEEWKRLSQGLPSFCHELYADFMAGYFLRLYRNTNPSITVQGVREQFEIMGGIPSDYMREDFHGTKLQRLRAIDAGYFHAQRNGRNLEAAAAQAYNHVSSPDY